MSSMILGMVVELASISHQEDVEVSSGDEVKDASSVFNKDHGLEDSTTIAAFPVTALTASTVEAGEEVTETAAKLVTVAPAFEAGALTLERG